MRQWVITYQHASADGRRTASVAIIPAETPGEAERVAERLNKHRDYVLLGLTTFKDRAVSVEVK